MENSLKQELIKNAVAKLDEPWKNLTVKDVAKDLKMGENLANELFKRKDFPSVNIGKTKTISKIAYELWKLEKRIIKVNRPPYPTRVKEGIKPDDNPSIKLQFKDNNKYINNKNSYLNYEQRDYSDMDWSKFYANF